MYIMYLQCPCEPEEGTGSFQTEVTDSGEPPSWVVETVAITFVRPASALNHGALFLASV